MSMIWKKEAWSRLRTRSDEVVFLLGAGASKDAGLPLAAELTHALRAKLVERAPKSRAVLEAIDPLCAHRDDMSQPDDYEEIFWWLQRSTRFVPERIARRRWPSDDLWTRTEAPDRRTRFTGSWIAFTGHFRRRGPA